MCQTFNRMFLKLCALTGALVLPHMLSGQARLRVCGGAFGADEYLRQM